MADKDYKVIGDLGTGAYGVVKLVEFDGQLAALKSQKVRDKTALEVCTNEV